MQIRGAGVLQKEQELSTFNISKNQNEKFLKKKKRKDKMRERGLAEVEKGNVENKDKNGNF